MELKLIGYWKSYLSDDYPFPQELEIDLDPIVRDRVADYLESGYAEQALTTASTSSNSLRNMTPSPSEHTQAITSIPKPTLNNGVHTRENLPANHKSRTPFLLLRHRRSR